MQPAAADAERRSRHSFFCVSLHVSKGGTFSLRRVYRPYSCAGLCISGSANRFGVSCSITRTTRNGESWRSEAAGF